jgi:hypothetical protein
MRYLFILSTVAFFVGCLGPTDKNETITAIAYIQFDFQQGASRIYIAASVEPKYQNTILDSVQALWFGSDTSSIADTLTLYDDGTHGDILRDDDLWATQVANSDSILRHTLSATDSGLVYVKIKAHYRGSIQSKVDSFSVTNFGPVILSVSMPDTMRLPGPDSLTISPMIVEVTDPNGIEDVQTVYLMFQKPDGTFSSGSPISLYDDGKTVSEMYLWDEVASDGKFSRLITIDHSNPVGTYHAIFYARDYSGIVSDPFTHKLVIIE